MADLPDPKLATVPRPMATPPTSPAGRTASNREEVIHIIPHPTTNRYPWVPVENPHLPLQQPITPPPIVRTPPAVTPQATQPLRAAPKPVVAPAPPPRSVVALPVRPKPVPAASTPVPVAPPIARPLPAPTPPPQPVIQARPVISQPPEPVMVEPPTEPVITQQSQPAQPTPVVASALPHIYSESTREAWRVFRPNKALKFLLLGFIILVVVGAALLWMGSGKQSVFNLPFLHSQ